MVLDEAERVIIGLLRLKATVEVSILMDRDRAKVGGRGCGVLGDSGVIPVRDKVLLIVLLSLVLVFPFILDSRGYRLQPAINLQIVLLTP